MISPARRVQSLPAYVFLELQRLRDEAVARGVDVIDLTVGNPTAPVPLAAIRTLQESVDSDPGVHGYPPFRGTPRLRNAVASWYARRFGVKLDPEREVLPLLGSKEGLYHVMQTFLNAGDTVLVPTPCYPAYLGAARLCEAEIVEIALREEDDFVLRVDHIDAAVAKAARMLLLNYPHNPTGAVATREQLRDVVAFCRDHDILLVSDLPYSELALDEDFLPPSVLELPGAREICVEMQSLSKSHSMAGWRVGFGVGNAEVLGHLARLKSNADFGMFTAIQSAAAAALDTSEESLPLTRRTYRERRDALCPALNAVGWPVKPPRAAMYVWARLPERFGDDDRTFVHELLERTGVLIAPGTGFGAAGRGYVRLSLVFEPARLREAAERIGRSGLVG